MITGIGLRSLLRRRLGWLLAGLGLMLLSLAAGLMLLALSGWLITASALAGLGLMAALDIFTPGAGIRLAAITRTVSRYGERLVTHEATFRLLSDLRAKVFARLLDQDEMQLKGLRRGDTLSRLTGDVDTLDHLFLGVAAPSMAAVTLTLIALIMLAQLDPVLALAGTGLLLVINPLTSALIYRLGQPTSRAAAQALPDLRTRLADGLEGLQELRALDQTAQYAQTVNLASNRLIDLTRRLSGLDAIGQGLALLVGLLAVWLGLIAGLDLYAGDQISAPILGLVVIALIGLNEAWLPLPATWRRLAQCQLAAERVGTLIQRPSSLACEPSPLAWPIKPDIRFESISYRYQPHHPAVCQEFSLQIGAGEKLLITGPSGSGKSTLALLIMRQIDPDLGRVLIGGCDVRRLDPDDLRRRIGYLPQHSPMFSDTLAANLRLADADAEDCNLTEVLHQVGLGNWLDSLALGLETWIEEGGANVSGGQARRIAMARLMLTNPDIVILDEPAANLDGNSIRVVSAALDQWLERKTAVIISHSTDLQIRDSNRIDLQPSSHQ
jgi:ATP-binding cassette, subfamily C, bacterial CydC